jgi:outer membrane protein TolC
MMYHRILTLLLAVHVGCASSRNPGLAVSDNPFPDSLPAIAVEEVSTSSADVAVANDLSPFQLASLETSPSGSDATSAAIDDRESSTIIHPTDVISRVHLNGIELKDVIQSVHQSYPLVQAAYLERQVANGSRISAWGEFDTKLKATSENGPLGFYETYRNSAGFTTPLYGGGEVFGGYRNGGGDFQPWYQERETNDGGEFKGGVRVPLIRDRDIDGRRASLWRATYDQQIADPMIRANLVDFAHEAGLAYWKWVAAGQKYKLQQQWLELAASRNEKIRRRVDLQDLDPPELIDNQRAIAKREAKLADSLRTLQQSAVKLSLFLRDDAGVPYIPGIEQLAEFPELRDIPVAQVAGDILYAQQNRPALQALDLQLKRLRVDYSEACNMTRAGLDAQLVGSQDVGEPTSSKRDKSEFELEAALFFDVPLQRRKGLGKMQAVQAKMSQVSAKRKMVHDKICAEVQSAYAGLIQSRQEALKAREAVALASKMADIERRKFELGQSDLLKVALREQYALEAAEEEIFATYNHFTAFTDYAAALASDRPTQSTLWLSTGD